MKKIKNEKKGLHSTKITGILKIQSGLLIEPKCTLGIFEYASENEINKIQNRKIKNKKRNRSRGKRGKNGRSNREGNITKV